MNKFLYFCIFHIYLTLPVQKATHVVKLSLSVDGISKGFLQLALFQQEAPNSVASFLKGCSCVRNKNCSDGNASFTQLLNKQHMTFSFPANKTLKWSSEINDLHTEFGALGQQRDTETGNVDEIYKIFSRRMDFDGSRSQWLVFGAIMRKEDRKLLEYLEWTAASSDGEPIRSVIITFCDQIII